jgi:hypothetical protein
MSHFPGCVDAVGDWQRPVHTAIAKSFSGLNRKWLIGLAPLSSRSRNEERPPELIPGILKVLSGMLRQKATGKKPAGVGILPGICEEIALGRFLSNCYKPASMPAEVGRGCGN